jgi:hypothetical protein
VGWQGVVLFAEGEEEPAVLEDIEGGAEIPERRHYEGDVFRDALHLGKEGTGIFDVFDRVGAEGVFELVRGEGQLVDVIDDDEVWDLGVFDDVDIDAAAVGLATADVEVPGFAPPPDDAPHDPVAEPIQGGKEDDEDGGGREQGEEHGV